jgi:acyl carrier protein
MSAPQRISAAVAAEALTRVLARRRGWSRAIDRSTPLTELQLESVELAEVFVEIEDATGCVAVTSNLPELVTVADFERIDCI